MVRRRLDRCSCSVLCETHKTSHQCVQSLHQNEARLLCVTDRLKFLRVVSCMFCKKANHKSNIQKLHLQLGISHTVSVSWTMLLFIQELFDDLCLIFLAVLVSFYLILIMSHSEDINSSGRDVFEASFYFLSQSQSINAASTYNMHSSNVRIVFKDPII